MTAAFPQLSSEDGPRRNMALRRFRDVSHGAGTGTGFSRQFGIPPGQPNGAVWSFLENG